MNDEPFARRYLDEPFIIEQIAMEHVQELLRPLCSTPRRHYPEGCEWLWPVLCDV